MVGYLLGCIKNDWERRTEQFWNLYPHLLYLGALDSGGITVDSEKANQIVAATQAAKRALDVANGLIVAAAKEALAKMDEDRIEDASIPMKLEDIKISL